MIATLAIVTACFAHPVELDREIGRRATPWMPPDLARQVQHLDRDFRRGAAAAAAWPARHHLPGGADGVEATILKQCDRLVAQIRGQAPFKDIIAGFGALAHLTLDLESPFHGTAARPTHAPAFASYLHSASPRIPLVFYGEQQSAVRVDAARLATLLELRRAEAASLGPLVVADLDRHGGPAAWRRLDDRSTSFGAASLVLNHAATDFATLASWVWSQAGGLVPPLPAGKDEIVVWRGEPVPRPAPLVPTGGTPGDTPRTRLGFGKKRH